MIQTCACRPPKTPVQPPADGSAAPAGGSNPYANPNHANGAGNGNGGSSRANGGRGGSGLPAPQGCGPDCLNRHSYIHCDIKSCPCGDACSNRPFHKLRQPKSEVFLTQNR